MTLRRSITFWDRVSQNWLLIFAVLLALLRWVIPERSFEEIGWRALVDSFFALGLLGVVAILGAAIGLRILRKIHVKGLSSLEVLLFSFACGLGVLAYGVMLLGFAGLFEKWFILGWIVLAAIWSQDELQELETRIPGKVAMLLRTFRVLGGFEKGFVVVAGMILILSMVQALSPPWAYDSLVYHLQAPSLFLQSGKIILLPEIWQANGPMMTEMLFTIGLAFESDVFAKLVHLGFGIMVVLATFGLGKRMLGNTGGWLTGAILLGIPIFPIWATLAYSDMALVFYEVVTVYAVILWKEKKVKSFLILGGFLMGGALGIKYLALGLLGILGSWVILESLKTGVKYALRSGMNFFIPAMLLGAPWYLKNHIMAGNPFFPFFFGGPGWNEGRLELLNSILLSFGAGRRWWEFLLLPWNLYVRHWEFGTLFTNVEYPSFFFPLAFVYIFLRNHKTLNWLALIAILRIGFWALASQQTRFLIPIYPYLSVITSYVLLWIGQKIPKPSYRRILAVGLVGGMTIVTLAFQAIYFISMSPLQSVVGMESKDSFLARSSYDYKSLRYIVNELPSDASVLMVWDGQGYYCDQRCIPDADQTRILRITNGSPEPEELGRQLLEDGVTHVLLGLEGLRFLFDPDGSQDRAVDYFFNSFVPLCANKVYGDRGVAIYELSCED